MPLELRARRIDERLAQAYAHAPELSRAEYDEMMRLAACFGAGLDCRAEWDAARASGLHDRYSLRGASFAIPDRLAHASTLALGGDRTRDLLTALATSDEGRDALDTFHAEQNRDDVIAMRLVSADLEQAIICDSADQAAGRQAGMPYDPAAAIPPGP